MSKNLSVIYLALVLIVVIAIFSVIVVPRTIEKPGNNNSGKIKVVTTLFPLYDMVRSIGADNVDVSLLLPPGVEPHTFDPTPSDIIALNSADVFVYTGKFMEPWVDDILESVNNKKLIVVDASQGVNLIQSVFVDADEPAGASDPHVWLDFDNAKVMAKNISQAIEAKDPNHADFYKERKSLYDDELTKLDGLYNTTLAKCRTKDVIYAGHYAFGYLAHRYGLQYVAAQGLAPDSEPTAADLARLVDQIKRDNIKYVFYEELASTRIAETLAKETGAQLLLLNAGHNITKRQFETGLTFFGILESNLSNLRIGLQCS